MIALLQVSEAVAGGQRRIDLRHRAGQGDRAAAIAADAGAAQPADHIVRNRQRAVEHRQCRGDVAAGVRIADRDAADRRADALGRTHRRGRHRVAGVVDLGDVDRHRVGGGERGALVLRHHRQRVAGVVALLQVSEAVAGGQRRADLPPPCRSG